MRKFLLVMFFIMFPALVHGATYYVAKTGSNSSSCSSAQAPSTPKLTINAGVGCLSAGDTLIVKAGTYVEDLVNVVPSGNAGNPTTVKANPGDSVILQPDHQPQNWLGGIVVTRDKSYITFDGLIVDLAHYPSHDAYVIEVFGPTDHHITIQNCEIRNAQGLSGGANASGIVVGFGSSYITVRNNKVHDVGPPTDNPSGPPAHGFYIGGATNSIFENNEAWRVQGLGFQMWTAYAGYTNNNNIVRNNILHDNPNRVGMLISSGDNIQVYNNIVYQNADGIQIGGYGWDTTNTQVYNNTVYANTRACILLGSAGQHNVSGTIVRNNICRQNGTDGIVALGGISVTADHNLLSTDPLFVNAVAQDFHLQAGSPAINAGVVVLGLPYNGPTPDLGAFETGAGEQLKNAPTNLRRIGN